MPRDARGGSTARPAATTGLRARAAARTGLPGARGGRTRAQKAGRDGACVLLALQASRALDRVGAVLRGHHVLQLELLLGGEREKLVGGLCRLERSFGALAARYDRRQRAGVGLDVADDAGLDLEGVAQRLTGRVEPTLRCRHPGRGRRLSRLARKQLAELLVDPGAVEVDVPRALHQAVDPGEGLLDLAYFREVDLAQVLGHVAQQRRLVLERLDLIVDLLERARRRKQVLAVVGGVEHRQLGMRRRSERGKRGGRRGEQRKRGTGRRAAAKEGKRGNQVDRATDEIRCLVARADGSEIHAVELEEQVTRAQRAEAAMLGLEAFRETAAALYSRETGSSWRPATGSRLNHSAQLTSAVVDGRAFLKARAESKRRATMPEGTPVVFAGGRLTFATTEDAKTCGENVWATLDKVRERVADMVLIHGGDGKGLDRIAASWAESRKAVQVTFALDARLGKRAGFRRNEQMLGLKPRYLVAFAGNGVLERLVIQAKTQGIAVVDRRGPLGTNPKRAARELAQAT